jgi:hypothetical protein
MPMSLPALSYYVVSTKYVGPRSVRRPEENQPNVVRIQTEPEWCWIHDRHCTEGPLGTFNDWSLEAHGAFSRLEDAEHYIGQHFKTFVISDHVDSDASEEQEGLLRVFGWGDYDPRTEWHPDDWFNDVLDIVENDIRKHISDEALEQLAADYEDQAERDGVIFSLSILDWLTELRAEILRRAPSVDA